MDHRLETDRLFLRPIAETDLTLYCALYCDAETMQLIGGPLSHEEAAANLAMLVEHGGDQPVGWRIWVLHDRHAGLDAGIVGLHLEQRIGEIGVLLHAPWRGRGVAAEAIRAVYRRAFADDWIDLAFTSNPAGHEDAERLMRSLSFTRSETPLAVRWELRNPAADDARNVALGAVDACVLASGAGQ